MNVPEAEVAVVGLGSMGCQALWQVARRGVSAIGIDQFMPGHDYGAGHGESRIIRSCYQEGPQYVPLVLEAFRQWRELEQEAGQHLLTENGALFIGRPDEGYIPEAIATAEACDLRHELLDTAEAARRYPQHRLGPDEAALLDFQAGYLRPEAVSRAAAARAEQLGARVVTQARVEGIEERGDHVEIRTAAGTFRAGQAIVAVGAWTGKLLPELGLPLRVERQVQLWFRAHRPEEFAPERFPVFIRERGERGGDLVWYGLPSLDGQTVKAALHHSGAEADPDHLDREVHDDDRAPVAELVATTLPGLDPQPVRGKACMYTNTPDGHFVLDFHPAHPEVLIASPCSGHGFKFASVLGEVMADLTLGERPRFDLGLFRIGRFAGAQP